MMNKEKITAFFDSLAPKWDENQKRNEEVIKFILHKSGVTEDKKILDVASGTGVLFEDYMKLGVGSFTGIDISAEMVKIAKEKYPQIEIICGDAEIYSFSENYDVVMIYNAFPHFADPHKLFANLSKALKKSGRLTVAHGISMEEVQKCHSGVPENVSLPLPQKEALAEIMSEFLSVDVMISDEKMYMVSGVKK